MLRLWSTALSFYAHATSMGWIYKEDWRWEGISISCRLVALMKESIFLSLIFLR